MILYVLLVDSLLMSAILYRHEHLKVGSTQEICIALSICAVVLTITALEGLAKERGNENEKNIY